MTGGAASAVLFAGDADAAAAVVAAAGASAATAAVAKMTARWVNLMMSCFLTGQASGCSRPPACLGDPICEDSRRDGVDGKDYESLSRETASGQPAAAARAELPIFRVGHAITVPAKSGNPALAGIWPGLRGPPGDHPSCRQQDNPHVAVHPPRPR